MWGLVRCYVSVVNAVVTIENNKTIIFVYSPKFINCTGNIFQKKAKHENQVLSSELKLDR